MTSSRDSKEPAVVTLTAAGNDPNTRDDDLVAPGMRETRGVRSECMVTGGVCDGGCGCKT